jgi:predicted secreted hydrolase
VTQRRGLLLLGAALVLPGSGLAAPAAIALPRDFGAHPESRIEWWYLTGALDVPGSADPFGFQITFFRARNASIAADHPSAFAARQILFAHAALTDPVARRLFHDQRIARAGFGIASASEGDTDVRLRDWALKREPRADGGHRYLARVAARDFGFDFVLAATQPVLLQGDAGWSRKGPGTTHASRYLSEPQLAVTGRLRRTDGSMVSVSGRAWLDHEWSDALLPPDAVGWDWVGFNLDDGGALTAFRLRRADGTALWAGGSHRGADGRLRIFGADEVRFTPLRWWQSPATQTRYPVQWRLDTPAGSHEVRARLDAQELDSRASTGTIYWEGLSDLLDAQGRRIGRGYLELTGYASPLRLG